MGHREPVLWTEGLFLSPQHLQQQDAYHDAARLRAVEALCGFYWGFTRLSFDSHALAVTKTVALSECRGILPSGIQVSIGSQPGDLPSVESLPVTWDEASSALDVVLALPIRSSGLSGEQAYARHGELARDPESGREVRVEFKRLNFKVWVGNEYPAGHEVVKIAELHKPGGRLALKVPALVRDEGVLNWVPGHLPPLLDIHAVPFVEQLIDTLVAGLAEKRVEAIALRDTPTEVAPDARALLPSLLALVGGRLPMLTHCRRQPCHPERLYVELAQLAGSLSELTGVDIGTIPDYDHGAGYPVFAALGAAILKVLQEPLVRQSIYHTVFQPDQNHAPGDRFVAGFPVNKDVRSPRRFLLSLHPAQKPGEGRTGLERRLDALRTNLKRKTRVAALERMDSAQVSGGPPIELKTPLSLPTGIPQKEDSVFLELDCEHCDRIREWIPLESGGRMGLWFPEGAAPPDLRVELWVC